MDCACCKMKRMGVEREKGPLIYFSNDQLGLFDSTE